MDLIQALFLAVIQGLTEWLPVSSSGHLALSQHFFGIAAPVSFDVMLHFGTLFAVVAYLRKDIAGLVRGIAGPAQKRLAVNILIACVPTAIIGFALKDYFKTMFLYPSAIAFALVVTGIILLASGNRNGKQPVSAGKAALIGVAQGIAVAPGISRSGATIGTGLLLGVGREEAARFSFLAAIPAIIGATIFEGKDAVFSGIDPVVVLLGTAVAALVGYASIAVLMKVLKKGRFGVFAYYCFGLAVLVLLASA